MNNQRFNETLARYAWTRLPEDAAPVPHVEEMLYILKTPALLADVVERAQKDTRPPIVCLCGSTRFWKEYIDFNAIETKAGKIVLSVGFFVHPWDQTPDIVAELYQCTPKEKAALDELHLRKIDLADEVLFLNRHGYMGDSTRAELRYAVEHNKVIRSIEPFVPDDHPIKTL
jgi:hypothetical protein